MLWVENQEPELFKKTVKGFIPLEGSNKIGKQGVDEFLF